jgi:Transposase, Mutator family
VRRTKDNRQVSKRYYCPEQTHCPRCHHVLKRAYPLWRKHLVFLGGRYLVISVGYWCRNPQCQEAKRKRMFVSQTAEALTLRGSSFALEVIVQIGYWRFWHRWTVAQIHEVLTQDRHLLISEREVLYLIGVFLVLLRCTYPLRLAEHAAYFRQHGLFLALDALKPEKGNTALYVVRELKFGIVLPEVALLTTDHRTLATSVLQPVKALGYRIRGVVSDDEKALQRAVAQVLPGTPHQPCQFHCLRDAAAPIAEADRAFKKALKQAIRAPLYAACRALPQLAPDDPHHLVLSTYAELIRSTLTEGSKPPFALGGLRVFEDLARLEASLRRSRKRGAIRCWRSCWRWCNVANPLPVSIGNSNVNRGGGSSWSGGLIRTKTPSPTPPVAMFSDRSRNFWRTWNSTYKAILKTPRWSATSARPSGNAGRGSLPATPGPNATAPTMIWKPSSVACGPVSAKFRAANRSTSLSCGMGNGPSSLTRLSPCSQCCTAFSNLTKLSLIGSMPGFGKCSTDYKCYIVFAISLGAVSSNWSTNGLRPFVAHPIKPHRVEFCGCC